MVKKKPTPKKKSNKTETIAKRIIKDKEKLLMELRKVPIIQVACARVGIDRSTFYRWKKDDEEFGQLADDSISYGISLINDLAESKMVNGINNGDKTFTIFWLKNRHSVYRDNHFPKQSDTRKETKGLSDERIAQIARSVKNWTKNLMGSSYDEEENDE